MIAPRPRINFESDGYIYDDQRTHERAACLVCRKEEIIENNRILVVKKGGAVEEFFCESCFESSINQIDWFAVFCVMFYTTAPGVKAYGASIHKIFGERFNYFHRMDEGILLTGRETTIEQMRLF